MRNAQRHLGSPCVVDVLTKPRRKLDNDMARCCAMWQRREDGAVLPRRDTRRLFGALQQLLNLLQPVQIAFSAVTTDCCRLVNSLEAPATVVNVNGIFSQVHDYTC